MIADFLEMQRPGGPWVLCALGGKGDFPGQQFDDANKAGAWALKQNRAKRNVYFVPNEVSPGVNKKPSRAEIARVDWIFVDIDPAPRSNWREEHERIKKLITEGLAQKGIATPTLVIDSGGGWQLGFKLRTPIDVTSNPAKGDEVEGIAKAMIALLDGDKSCFSIDHIYRLPGTTNYASPEKLKKQSGRPAERQAEVWSWTRESDGSLRTYAFEDFAALVKQSPTSGGGTQCARVPPGDATGSPGEWVSGHAAPFGTDELRAWCRAQGKWHEGDDKPPPGRAGERLLAVIALGKDPIEPTKYASRSEAQFYVSCELVRLGVPDDVHYRILTTRGSGIAESVLEKRDWHDYALRQIGAAREEADREWWRSPEGALAYLNSRHAVISDIGGKCRIISETVDEEREDRRVIITLQSFEDFRNRYRHIKVVVGFTDDNKPIAKPVGAWWVDHMLRQQFEGMVFAPGRITHSSYNLWRGFAVEARPGDKHQSLLAHVRNNLCSNNEEHFTYLIGWMARAVQQPGRQGEVAVVMRGGRGTGKSFFGQSFGALFGRHFLEVSNPKHLVGNFNAHLRDTVLLFGDEAFFAGDKQHESVLKTLVTSQNLVIEGKHVDAKLGRNYTHLILASNDSWVVPAGEDERRYFVLDVSDTCKQDYAYFSAIQQDLDSGGLQNLLDYLLGYDLSAFEVRKVPATDALKDQKAESLRGFEAYLLDLLLSGQEPDGTVEHIHGGRFVPSRELLHDAGEWLRGKPGNQHVSYNKIQVLLEGKLGILKERNGRSGLNGYVWSLDDLRTAWNKAMFPVNWTPATPPDKMPF